MPIVEQYSAFTLARSLGFGIAWLNESMHNKRMRAYIALQDNRIDHLTEIILARTAERTTP